MVFLKGNLRQYREYICKVLDKLKETGLHLDINKCEFEIVDIKYLGFVIEAGKGIYINLNKIKVIKE